MWRVADEATPPLRVIGIGASAGGVDALTQIVAALPADLPHAILVVLHLPAGGRSLLAAILDRTCALPVSTAEDGQALAAGGVLVAPPDHHLLVRDGRVALTRGPKESAARPAVDAMLRSIALSSGPAGVAVVLSGALGDGSNGALMVARAGGMVIVQDPKDAIMPSMPEHALAAVGDKAHSSCPPRRSAPHWAASEMRGRRCGTMRRWRAPRLARPTRVTPRERCDRRELRGAARVPQASRGFDFTGYKRGSLERRFNRRMEAIGCGSYGDYLDYLEVHPEEFEELFDTLLINVTSFFRDAAAWQALRER